MLPVDLVFLLLTFAQLISWWRSASRNTLLTLSALMLLTLAVGYNMHRWQLVPGVLVLMVLWPAYYFRSRKPERGVPWLSGSLGILLALPCAFLLYTFPINPLPEPSGEHPVGVADFELVDAGRTGLLGAATGEPRRLLVRVWYPASEVTDLTPRSYFSEQEASSTATGPGSFIGLPFLFTHLANLQTNSFPMAKPIDADALPVVIYSHGYTSFLAQNTALMEHLASHGYLVFSIHHTGDSAAAVMPNGDVIPTDPELLASRINAPEPEGRNPFIDLVAGDSFEIRRQATIDTYEAETMTRLRDVSAQIWVDDRDFVQRSLAAGLVPDSALNIVKLGDFTRTGEMGMSFGGTTAASFCMDNDRCAAAVNLDGGDYHFNTFNRQMPVPFLMVYSDVSLLASLLTEGEKTTGHGFNEFSYERHELAGFNQDIHRIRVSNVMHLGVSDSNWFTRGPVRDALLGSIEGGAMLSIQNDLVRGFFDRYLRETNEDFRATAFATHAEHIEEYDVSEELREDWLSRNPKDKTVRVIMETELGNIELAIYPERAPISAANFLAHVDGGHYDNTSFYRATRFDKGSSISVIQGGRASDAMAGPEDQVVNSYALLPPIEHETTELTGINNERGAIAYARFAPGTAGSEFFFNVHDNPGLNSGDTAPHRDGLGYATFGRVISGHKVLEAIQGMPTERETEIERLNGQLFTQPVSILRVYREQ